MRLTTYEQKMILKAFQECFGSGEVYLYGSRVDNEAKGGDIDLYLVPDKKYNDEYQRKIKFLNVLEEYLGEQKIDAILHTDKNRPIEQIAIRDGVVLDEKRLKIEKYLNECKKHSMRIEKAYNKVKHIFPLSAQKYESLNDDEVEAIDQYLFRFAKMQDTIGEKLFKMIVSEYVEDINNLTFIDILNRLEKIGILQRKDDWKILRNIRNNISHQYDDDSHEMAMALNEIFAQKDVLLGVSEKVLSFYKNLWNI